MKNKKLKSLLGELRNQLGGSEFENLASEYALKVRGGTGNDVCNSGCNSGCNGSCPPSNGTCNSGCNSGCNGAC